MTLVQKEVKAVYLGTTQVRPSGGGGGWQPGANTVAYYPLEADVNDYSGNGYNLTPSNITYTTLSSGLKVATFNGSNSKATTSSFYSSGGDFTFNIRFYGDSLSGTLHEFWCNATSDSYGRNFDVYKQQNMIRCNSAVTGSGFYQNNTWYNVVVTCSGSTWKLYINNNLVSTVSSSYGGTGSMAIGYRIYGNDRYWKGYISKLILEDQARTTQEVEDYYDLTKGDYGIS